MIWHEKPITGPYHNSSRLMILLITQPLDSCQECTLRMIHKGNQYVEFSAHFAVFVFNKSGLKNIIPGWPVSFVCWYSETKKIQEKLTLLSPLSDKIWTMTSQLVKNHLKLDLLVMSSLLIKPFQIFHQSPHRTFFKILLPFAMIIAPNISVSVIISWQVLLSRFQKKPSKDG